MDLILWRHAEAEDPADGQDDLSRLLTPRGHRQARRMAQWLEQALPAGARILVSPARRTVQTAEALGRKYQIVERIAPDASASDLLEAAGWPDARRPVMLVGHQPTLGEVAGLLLTGAPQPLAVRKGAIWWLTSRDEERACLLKAVASPDLLLR